MRASYVCLCILWIHRCKQLKTKRSKIIVKRTVIIDKDFKMSGHSIFHVFSSSLSYITTTVKVTSYNSFHGGKINDMDIFNVNIYCPSFECGYHLPQSLTMLPKSLSLPVVDNCIGVKYINNGVTFSQSQQCVKIIDDNQLNIEVENELLEKLELFLSL